jgi:anti-sigma factor RsiW
MDECVHFAPMLGSRDDELSPEERVALTAHLAGCERCSAIAADLAATDGLVAEALLARANARDFAPFVEEVMARVGAPATGRRPAEAPERASGVFAWLGRHRRAVLAWAMPVLAAAVVVVYVRRDGGTREVAALEVSAEGDATMVLETSDGPVVLLGESS